MALSGVSGRLWESDEAQRKFRAQKKPRQELVLSRMGLIAGWLHHPAHARYHHDKNHCDLHDGTARQKFPSRQRAVSMLAENASRRTVPCAMQLYGARRIWHRRAVFLGEASELNMARLAAGTLFILLGALLVSSA
ncbi:MULTISPECIES: hypothetical protein [unclassified Rhizobium]|uniref:hypothetical protein n=1 Tax=unclassified Rhizobium TaxID=2613769 RepID=UPI001EF09A60|nr:MULTISPECIES: hypothetical protein [unclassified Rhizobium]